MHRGTTAEGLFRDLVRRIRKAPGPATTPLGQQAPGGPTRPGKRHSLSVLRSLAEDKSVVSALAGQSSHVQQSILAAVAGAVSNFDTPAVPPSPCPPPAVSSTCEPFQVAAFRNQVASPPGQHGVPFEPTRTIPSAGTTPGRSTTPAASPPSSAPSPPPPTASRTDVITFLQAHKACFGFAFNGRCRRPHTCNFRHDLVAPGFYKQIAGTGTATSPAGRPERATRLCALSQMDYEAAVDMGWVTPVCDSGDEGKEQGAAQAQDQQLHSADA